MTRIRTERDAHHVLAWGGCMRPSPYRLHSQGYTPPPARRINWLRRVLRSVVGALT